MMKDTPVYRSPSSYAHEHGELELYRASQKANLACKEAIEAAISENYRDNRLNTDAVKQVMAQFGQERVMYVLANTVQQKDWDGRISSDNKAWAKTVPVFENPDAWGTDRNCYFVVNSHPGLTDLFVTRARKELAEQAKEQRPSVHELLKKQPERNSPKVSANFKGQER